MVNKSNPPVESSSENDIAEGSAIHFINSRIILLVVAGVGLVILVVGIVLYVIMSQPLVPASKAQEVPFSVYSPKSSPEGYSFVEERVNYSNSTFSYIFEEGDGESELTVTIQPKPDTFDMSAMSEGGSINSTSTKNGALYNLSASGNSQYLLDTGESLVFFRANKNLDSATMNSLADSLIKIN